MTTNTPCPECGGKLKNSEADYGNPSWKWRCEDCYTYWCDMELEEERKYLKKNNTRKMDFSPRSPISSNILSRLARDLFQGVI